MSKTPVQWYEITISSFFKRKICHLSKSYQKLFFLWKWIVFFQFPDKLDNVKFSLFFSRQYPLITCYLDSKSLKMITFAHYQKARRNGCFFENSVNKTEEFDVKPSKNSYNKTEFWSFYGPLLALVLCLVIFIIVIRRRLRKNVSKVTEETRSVIDILSAKSKSLSNDQEEN